MARAHSIWIIRCTHNRCLVGAWTVKHEMVTWLKHINLTLDRISETLEVCRLRDGKPEDVSIIPWSEIL